MALPLEGLLVFALEQAVSAPHCTRQLADMGARVIKVESGTGDTARFYDDAVGAARSGQPGQPASLSGGTPTN